MTETWKAVKGWEGFYAVSDKGRFKSLERTVTYSDGRQRVYPENIRSGSVAKNGYLMVGLNKAGKCFFYYLHRIVAETFLANPEGYPVVRHLNDQKTDNVLENLAWGTHSDNREDAKRNKRDYWALQEECLYGHPFDEKNTRWDSGNKHRTCRSCERRRVKEYQKRKKSGV